MSPTFRFSSGEFLNFELTRILSTAPFEGCEIAEFLEAAALASRAAGNPERWHTAWHTAGERAEALAAEAAALGHAVSARHAYLRACNYFRASAYMMAQADHERIFPLAERSVRNFEAALPLMDHAAEKLSIPYRDPDDGKTYQLPGYLYLSPDSKRLPAAADGDNSTPVLVVTCGADSSQEEHYYMFVAAAVQLGYAVLTFEGPGQSLVLRKQGLPFRPDWEVVISAVLDELSSLAGSRPQLGLDLTRVALAGVSMGGYLALRGAADERVSACVSIDPFYSLWDFVRARLPGGLVSMWMSGWLPDTVLDNLAKLGRYASGFQSRWEFEMSKWMFGVDKPSDLFRRVMQFTLGPPNDMPKGKGKDDESYLHRIHCPVMVTGAGQSLYFQNLDETTHKIHRHLANVPGRDKVIWVPATPSEGGFQAKIGAFGIMQLKTFAFLDDKFGIKRNTLAL